MHDPLVVAFHIPNPLRIRRRAEYDYDPTVRNVLKQHRWHWFGTHAFVVAGKAFGFGELITVWHREPGGHDAGEVCKHWKGKPGSRKISHVWRFHVHHWSLQFHPWQRFRRWALTRCAWCGGRSRKGDVVNVSHQWDGDHGPWWKGETGLFHHDCSTVARAKRTCLCDLPVLNHDGYGKCEMCGGYRAWRQEPGDDIRMLHTLNDGQRIPVSMRPHLEAIWNERLRAEGTDPKTTVKPWRDE